MCEVYALRLEPQGRSLREEACGTDGNSPVFLGERGVGERRPRDAKQTVPETLHQVPEARMALVVRQQ